MVLHKGMDGRNARVISTEGDVFESGVRIGSRIVAVNDRMVENMHYDHVVATDSNFLL